MLFLNQRFRGNTFLATVFCLFLLAKADAQSRSNLRLNVEDLYSTHGNHFPGVSASYNRYFGKKWELGAGMEYSYTGYHDDNGWDLYHLNFIPVYLSEYFYIGTFNRWKPYVHLQEGVSFARYDKEFQDQPGVRYKIREAGFYGYGGAGTGYVFTQKSGLFLEAGMKAFHLSFNNLDVNPHGFALKLGYVYRLK
ncbi:hypothetical protein [Niabella beijingensis]|uniref:hypothetical protein n=1 Tax=Niabella beijingensis TaxID=2872700 RepID=UPI001CC0263D|nr:hypothetical protein [Niabella beijingensis]MBZ4191452.1 hypothetical protein [Niabella beijingensis]